MSSIWHTGKDFFTKASSHSRKWRCGGVAASDTPAADCWAVLF